MSKHSAAQTLSECGGLPMSGRIAKSQIPIRHQASLPCDALRAYIEAKNLLKAGGALPIFFNSWGNSPLEGPPLPEPSQGCIYYERQVGEARPGDQRGRAGSKRLVLEVNEKSEQLMEAYYTEQHYGKFTFWRIV